MTNKGAIRNKLDRIRRELAGIKDELLWLDQGLVAASVHVDGAINDLGLAIGNIPHGPSKKAAHEAAGVPGRGE